MVEGERARGREGERARGRFVRACSRAAVARAGGEATVGRPGLTVRVMPEIFDGEPIKPVRLRHCHLLLVAGSRIRAVVLLAKGGEA